MNAADFVASRILLCGPDSTRIDIDTHRSRRSEVAGGQCENARSRSGIEKCPSLGKTAGNSIERAKGQGRGHMFSRAESGGGGNYQYFAFFAQQCARRNHEPV